MKLRVFYYFYVYFKIVWNKSLNKSFLSMFYKIFDVIGKLNLLKENLLNINFLC